MQLVTEIDGQLAADLDELVQTTLVESREDAVRQGLQLLIERHRRRRAGDQPVSGYRALPPTEDDLARSEAEATRMAADEPW